MKVFKKLICFILSLTLMSLTCSTFLANAAVRNDVVLSEDLPSCHYSNDSGYVTSVKNQGESKSSWAFAAASAIESSLLKNNSAEKDIDLSELHMTYFGTDYIYDELGLLIDDKVNSADGELYPYMNLFAPTETATYILADNIGVIDEKDDTDFSFENAKAAFFYYDSSKAYSENKYSLKNAYWIPMTDIQRVKEYILNYGSCNTSINYNPSFFNSETSAYCMPKSQNSSAVNQGIAIVGWNDSFSDSKFSSAGASSGAWLVKNSLGSEFGKSGYFWLSYEDASVLTQNACFYEMTDASQRTYYQYDGTSLKKNYSENSPVTDAYMSNVYTAQKNSLLKEIGFYTYDSNISYEISILTDVKAFPNIGTSVAAVSGVCEAAGYHTVSLDSAVNLINGEKFAVILRLYSNENKNVQIPCDFSEISNGIEYTNSALPGQSYYSSDRVNWKDVSEEGYNFRIKAITDDVDITDINLTESSVSMKINETHLLKTDIVPNTADNNDLIWYSDNSEVAYVDFNGKVTAISQGTATITAASPDESVKDTCKITVSGEEVVYDPIDDSMIDLNVYTINNAIDLTSENTVIGQVVYSYADNSNGERTNIVIEDIVDGKIYGMLISDKENYSMYNINDIVQVTGEITSDGSNIKMTDIKNIKVIEQAPLCISPINVSLKNVVENPESYVNKYIVVSDVVLGEYVPDEITDVSSEDLSFSIYHGVGYPLNVTTGYTVDLYCTVSEVSGQYYFRVANDFDYYNEDQTPVTDITDEVSYFTQVSDVGALEFGLPILISVNEKFLVNKIENKNLVTDTLEIKNAVVQTKDAGFIWYLEKIDNNFYLRSKKDNYYYGFSIFSGGTDKFDSISDECALSIESKDGVNYLKSVKYGMYLSVYTMGNNTFLRWQIAVGPQTANIVFYKEYFPPVNNGETEKIVDEKIVTRTDKLTGDVNFDGKISMLDVTQLQKYIASIIEFDDIQLLLADVDYDDEVSMLDVTTIQRYIASLIEAFPAGNTREIVEVTGNPEYVRMQIENMIKYVEVNLDEKFDNSDEKYTEESFTRFINAYNNALKIIENTEASYEELSLSYNSLVISEASLVKNNNKYTIEELTEILNEYRSTYGGVSINDGPYTENSYNTYKMALISIDDALADLEGYTNDMLVEMANTLKNAYTYLVYDIEAMTKERLVEYIIEVLPESTSYIENKDLFEQESFTVFEDAYNQLKKMIDDPDNYEQYQIYAAYQYLLDTIENLSFI